MCHTKDCNITIPELSVQIPAGGRGRQIFAERGTCDGGQAYNNPHYWLKSVWAEKLLNKHNFSDWKEKTKFRQTYLISSQNHIPPHILLTWDVPMIGPSLSQMLGLLLPNSGFSIQIFGRGERSTTPPPALYGRGLKGNLVNKGGRVIIVQVREGAKNILRGGCLNLALLRSKIPTPPKNGNIGLDPP